MGEGEHVGEEEAFVEHQQILNLPLVGCARNYFGVDFCDYFLKDLDFGPIIVQWHSAIRGTFYKFKFKI